MYVARGGKSKRRSIDEKKTDILDIMAIEGERLYRQYGEYVAMTPGYVAQKLGYKSPVSVREALYQLVDEEKVIMRTEQGKGAVDSMCWFYHPDFYSHQWGF